MSRKDQIIDDLQHLATEEKAGHLREKRMPDDPAKAGSDRTLISMDQDHEVRTWALSLGCSEQDLREAVATVGNSVDEVRRYINHRKV